MKAKPENVPFARKSDSGRPLQYVFGEDIGGFFTGPVDVDRWAWFCGGGSMVRVTAAKMSKTRTVSFFQNWVKRKNEDVLTNENIAYLYENVIG